MVSIFKHSEPNIKGYWVIPNPYQIPQITKPNNPYVCLALSFNKAYEKKRVPILEITTHSQIAMVVLNCSKIRYSSIYDNKVTSKLMILTTEFPIMFLS